jgi:hypothetical protein
LGADVVSLLLLKEHTAQSRTALVPPHLGNHDNANTQVVYEYVWLF